MVSRRSGGFGKGRQANPKEWLMRLSLPSFLSPTHIIKQLQGPIEPLAILARVIGEASGALIGKGLWRNKVSPAHLGRVQREVSSDEVHGAFDTERCLRAPGASVSASRRLVSDGAEQFQSN